MIVTFNVEYRNSDTGDDHPGTIEVEIEAQDSPEFFSNALTLDNDAVVQMLKGFLAHGEYEGTQRGLAYEGFFNAASRNAWEKLGWHDVTLEISEVKCFGDSIIIDEDWRGEWAIQLVRGENHMYFINF